MSSIKTPTVSEIAEDRFTKLADLHWSLKKSNDKKFSPEIIKDIYNELIQENFPIPRIILLEFNHYLENYLWPNFDYKKSSIEHTMSILLMINEKCRQGVPAWDCFHNTREKEFHNFFQRALDIFSELKTYAEKTIFIVFLINCYHNIEDKIVGPECLRLVSLPLWNMLSESRREFELNGQPLLKKHWKRLKKKQKKEGNKINHESTFFSNLITDFLNTLNTIKEEGNFSEQIRYCERFLELLIDLISQLPTRRFFNTVLQDIHLYVKCKLSSLAKRKDGRLFNQLLDMLLFYIRFEINEHTGEEYTDEEKIRMHTNRLLALQRVGFKFFNHKLKELSLINLSKIETREFLTNYLSELTDSELRQLCVKLRLLDDNSKSTESREELLEILIINHEKRLSQLDKINQTPLYPTEEILWDGHLVPSSEYDGTYTLALPKLNLQFLTLHDYLLRNFTLYRLESTYQIKQDIEEVITKMKGRFESGKVIFKGWHKMALPIRNFRITSVETPKLGEQKPSQVLATVSYSLASMRGLVREEWEGIKKHDVLFLVSIQTKLKPNEEPDPKLPFWYLKNLKTNSITRERFGVKSIRGCEVIYQSDAEGKEFTGVGTQVELSGNERNLLVELDPVQYIDDRAKQTRLEREDDPYSSFNLLIRRKSRENNFKAVLDTIRDIINENVALPEWFHDLFLGYGDPDAANYFNIPERLKSINLGDTLQDVDHIKQTLPNAKVLNQDIKPPFRVTFPETQEESLIIEPYREPFRLEQPYTSTIRFTPNQVKSIISGSNYGLTMVVGPPGTGKTDVAVQIIYTIYHNFKNERTLFVTHSNHGLNDLFEKLLKKDINQSHMLRLGKGEEELDTDDDFSKFGRVNYMLQRRLDLLEQVKHIASALGESTDFAISCEATHHFFLAKIKPKWDIFKEKCERQKTVETIQKEFPFSNLFPNVFEGKSFDEDMYRADGCYKYITDIVSELEDYRPLELVRGNSDRGNYILTKHAKIIAMTCTHAALKRRDFVKLGFQYDNLIIEEASQILDIETFIPMVLQNSQDGKSRLKRIVLLGDHHQLPPIIKNRAFQKFSHFDQSLFTRLIRLNATHYVLDYQGRMRSSLCDLFRWRYKNLSDLPFLLEKEEFQNANAGFCYEYQLIDVGDYYGKGEIQPSPHYYQNLGEAEYLVAVYMYMRLIGYPSEKISILTTYNGQKQLIRDVLERRCKLNPIFGMPHKVETVDRYQGQQNDYILLSLVRTKSVGHIRDIRRLIVALSRARLGLYIFCRKSLFENCYEISPAFSKLLQRPVKLCLIQGETYPCTRKVNTIIENPKHISDVTEMGKIVYDMAKIKIEEYKKQQIEINERLSNKLEEQMDHEASQPLKHKLEDATEPPSKRSKI